MHTRFLHVMVACAALAACGEGSSDSSAPGTGGSGNSGNLGGTGASGGTVATGGVAGSTGGAAGSTGGAAGSTGGAAGSTGGAVSGGAAGSTGGAVSGGAGGSTGGAASGGAGGSTGGAGGTSTEGDDPGECFDGKDNDADGLTDCADTGCAGVACRPKAGDCDAVEVCTGGACPADQLEPSSKVCRPAAGGCDVAESCSGASPSCPADAVVPAATVCRPVAGDCDLAEACDGSAPACPLDTFAAAGVVCRAAAGVCDAVETCTGSAANCPADALRAAGDVCRGAAPTCDVAETCTGTSVTCPAEISLSTLSGFKSISSNGLHTCALTMAGAVKCWGSNEYGQIGDGTTVNRATPAAVSSLGSGNLAVAAGGGHSCAVTAAGGVKCWGRNGGGQLGNGATTDSATEVDVSGLSSGVTAVAAGRIHSCALTAAGGLKCWGGNSYGQLGNGSTTNSPTPVDVVGLSSGVVAVATGSDFTCAITGAGGLKCWGLSGLGQLGAGTTASSPTPVDVVGLSSVVSISCGDFHACAVTAGGGVWCWGEGKWGQLGNGAAADTSTPLPVSGLSTGATSVSAGQTQTCARTSTGGLKCWGYNSQGEVGDGTRNSRYTPVDVVGASNVVMVQSGASHVCALTASGEVTCWGSGYMGMLGDGTSQPRTVPISVAGLPASGVTAINTGSITTCALVPGGVAKCWGDNTNGQLGNGSGKLSAQAADVTGLGSGVADVAVGFVHACAVTASGGVKCWGENQEGELGNGSTTASPTPVDVVGLTAGAKAVAVGFYSCALTTGGGVKCWGGNAFGQLGNGTNSSASTPVDVTGLATGVKAISLGWVHACALTTAGGVKCWGRNEHGQLGDGTKTDRATPTDVTGLSSGVVAIAGGGAHTCAITANGALSCWGRNWFGNLGDGTTTSRDTPTPVVGLSSGVVAVGAGEITTCAVTFSGGVKCWGDNLYGTVGDGTTVMRVTPTDVVGLSSGQVAVDTNHHSCALSATGAVTCWGLDEHGEVSGVFMGYPRPICG